MENVDLILEVSNLMPYESRDEKKGHPCREKDREKCDGKGGGQNPIVAVVEDIVWRQPTSPLW